MNYRTFLFFFKRVYKHGRGDVWSIRVLLLGVRNIICFFLKAAFVRVSLSNKCIILICLQRSKLTWQPNVPNASGVGLFWDKKYPLELPYSILILKIIIWEKYKGNVGKLSNF